jgi:hypothetical protein
MGNSENTIFNLVLKLTFPLVQYYFVQIVHYMIHFHYRTTFQVLSSLMILTRSWKQDKINVYKHNLQVKGQFMSELFHNTDHTLQYYAAFAFFAALLFICRLGNN